MHWMTRLLATMVAIVLLISAGLPVIAQDAPGSEDLQSLLDEHVGLVDGGAAVITIRDGVVTTASSGIANAAGDLLTIDTPLLVGIASAPMVYVVALRLVERGLLSLDDPVTDYLPGAPVGDGATVRDLLEARAGGPDVFQTLLLSMADDPDRTWTTADMVSLADPSEIVAPGVIQDDYLPTLLTIQLIEVVTGRDFGSLLEEEIVVPLGLSSTAHPGEGVLPPQITAGGWPQVGVDRDVTYVTSDWEAMRTHRPTVSSVRDLVTFYTALVDGRLLSPEMMEATIWNEDIETIGYGFRRSDLLFGGAGPLGTRYFGTAAFDPSGAASAVAVAPSSGDMVVAVSNSWELDSFTLATDLVRAWAPDPLAAGNVSTAEGTVRLTTWFTCNVGVLTPFDKPDCLIDEERIHMTFDVVADFDGTFDGIATESAVWIQDLENDTFTYTADGLFMGEVEGCGEGVFYFTVQDGAGDIIDGRNNFTSNTFTILPGGSLNVAGTYESLGLEVFDPETFITTVEYSGSYSC